MAYLRTLSRLVYTICGGDLMDIMNFITDNSGLMLAGGKDTHKAYQFLDAMRTVIVRACAREYLLANPLVLTIPTNAAELRHFYAWIAAQKAGGSQPHLNDSAVIFSNDYAIVFSSSLTDFRCDGLCGRLERIRRGSAPRNRTTVSSR